MGRMLFVLRYRNGEPEPLGTPVLREVLGPYAVAADADFRDGVLIRTIDGHDVEIDVNEVCLAVSRFPPGQFFDVLARLVDRLGASVVPMNRPAVLRREEDRAHLPPAGRREAVVVAMTGRALEAALTDGGGPGACRR
ncbi:hypothetical protein [Streptomyces virginiae]|uniref:hypothetical protein n=1 Tax=Streptomyces virginiae TaxID=1961 RepID=UPI00344BFE25